jgi:3-deoxy-7-phosphoheptulonate synthase
MVIVMSTDAKEADIQRVLDRLGEQNCRGELTIGVERTIITVVGPSTPALEEDVRIMPYVDSVVRLQKSYKLAGRDGRPDRTPVEVNGVAVGGDAVALFAGPGTVESAAQIDDLGAALREAGAIALTGATMRPEQSPYAFQGLGEDGLRMLAHAAAGNGLATVTEAPSVDRVEIVARYADVLEIGPHNMRNFGLLEAVAATGKPVLLRRDFASTLDEWLLSAEHLLVKGNDQVILCESGLRSFEGATPATTDISAVPMLRSLTHLPVVVDPASSSGAARLVPPLALAALAAGADGLVLTVHPNPQHALVDGPQSLTPAQLASLVAKAEPLLAVLGRSLARPE